MKKLVPTACMLALILILASPAAAQVGFGRSVAASDGEVLVGEPGNLVTSGIVYVYRPDSGTWQEVAELTASDATEGDGFGLALAVRDDMLLVGADAAGAVYVFRRADGAWAETARLTVEGAGEDWEFGGALAVDGDHALVGAPGYADGRGAAWLFRRSEDGWAPVTMLGGDAPDPEAPAGDAGDGEDRDAGGDGGAAMDEDADDDGESEPVPPRFGSAVALQGDWAFVGATGEAERSGALYVFRREGEAWQRYAKLGDDVEAGDRFGSAVAVAGDELYVGAIGAASAAGAVHAFAWSDDDQEWTAAGTLLPFDGSSGSLFGSDIVPAADALYVAAPGAGGFEGRVFRFERGAAGEWASVSKIAAAGLARRSGFGSSLAVHGDVLVAGMPGDDYGAGTAMIMDRGLGGWTGTKVLSEVKGLDPVTGGPVSCQDGTARIFPCQDVDLLSFLPVHEIGGGRGVRTNDIWGWTDPETSRQYALVGLSDATSFVDTTDPLEPVYVGKLPKTEGSPGSVWRDIKVHADHAFIVSDAAGEHGVQIFDLTELRRFDGEPIVFRETAHYDRIHSAHNIVINQESAFAYVVGASGGGETCGGGLHMIDIEDPRNPMFAGCFADARTGRRGTGYSHDAQCVIYHGPDERYEGREICFGSNETALSIADVTEKREPVAVGMASYPNVAYTHQGWLTEDHRYFVMNDEGDEVAGTVEGTRTLIFDVQELDDPILAGEYVHDVESVDHNIYVVGNLAYQSNYDSGLRLLDVSDPEQPRPAGYFDTVPWGDNSPSMGGGSWSNYPFFSGDYVAVTSGREGLFLLRARNKPVVTPDPND